MLSVIITFVNKDKPLLKNCLISLEQSARFAKVALEFILVANGTSITKPNYVKSPMHILINKANIGFGAAVNRGLEKVKSEWCIIACPDTRCEKEIIKALIPYLSETKLAIVGPKVRQLDGSTQATIVPIPTLNSIFIEQSYLYKLVPAIFSSPLSDAKGYRYAHRIDAVAAIWWLVNCNALRRVGGFDERYFLYFEDVDLCKRLREAGFHVFYEPRARIRHLLHQSTGGGASGRLYKESMQKFLKKHYSDSILFLGNLLLVVGSVVRLIYWSFKSSERAKQEVKFYREILHV